MGLVWAGISTSLGQFFPLVLVCFLMTVYLLVFLLEAFGLNSMDLCACLFIGY